MPAAPPQPRSADTLFCKTYARLHRLARHELYRSGRPQGLGTRSLVHMAWEQLQRRSGLQFEDQDKFVSYLGCVIRGLLIDSLRQAHADRRGGGLALQRLGTLTAEQLADPAQTEAEVQRLQAISEALDVLARQEPRLAQVVNLHFFGGLTHAEVAALRGVTVRTVERDWAKARLLLQHALAP